jgi:hypothetical protein
MVMKLTTCRMYQIFARSSPRCRSTTSQYSSSRSPEIVSRFRGARSARRITWPRREDGRSRLALSWRRSRWPGHTRVQSLSSRLVVVERANTRGQDGVAPSRSANPRNSSSLELRRDETLVTSVADASRPPTHFPPVPSAPIVPPFPPHLHQCGQCWRPPDSLPLQRSW